ncbi:flavin reductase family protein [Streptomyces sp. TS71-3]|uniref:flavin reductase family protein n=1 Tax=Streptomyces sp. TS71-3 TaxID=2733862 RepID=UPI001B107C3D|nr:flavin reductase family protein [Streptomyces sp. TS71-3]GHJ42331.1 flavin-dependent reductase [Streptomyces sp. TS71-3]
MTVSAVSPGPPPGIAQDRFKQVFRRHPGGVVVVTVDAGRGPAGFTATSLTSVSLNPPLVSFAIAGTSSSWPHVEAARTAVVHFLDAGQEALARRFATHGADRFAAPTKWRPLATGEPLLDGVAGWLRLGIEQLVPAGDHHLVVARVVDAWVDTGRDPLLFHDGAYHPLRTRTDLGHALPHHA